MSQPVSPRRRHLAWLCLGLALAPLGAGAAQALPSPATTSPAPLMDTTVKHGIRIDIQDGQLAVRFVAPGIVHVQHLPAAAAPTLVLDPAAKLPSFAARRSDDDAQGPTLASERGSVRWDRQQRQLRISDARQQLLLQIELDAAPHITLSLRHDPRDALYGIGGYNATEDASAGMLRSGKQVAMSGEQGHAGAPFVWSSAGYGVLLDSDGATFTLAPGAISAVDTVRPRTDYYILLGTPAQIFAELATLSGRTPLFPKWAMGFTNSQWGIDQKELLQIVDAYRARHIPLDNITLDFDWKAWGEDDYGEFRWNPAKFPDGPSGALKQQMDARGIRLTGIMKPRIHLDTVEGRYASTHGFWVPGEKVSEDYFSHKPVKNIDFDIPAARTWFAGLR